MSTAKAAAGVMNNKEPGQHPIAAGDFAAYNRLFHVTWSDVAGVET